MCGIFRSSSGVPYALYQARARYSRTPPINALTLVLFRLGAERSDSNAAAKPSVCRISLHPATLILIPFRCFRVPSEPHRRRLRVGDATVVDACRRTIRFVALSDFLKLTRVQAASGRFKLPPAAHASASRPYVCSTSVWLWPRSRTTLADPASRLGLRYRTVHIWMR